MSPAVLSFIQAAFDLVPIIVKAEQDTVPLATKLYTMIKGGADPTSQDWADLAAIETAQSAIIDAPIPGEDALPMSRRPIDVDQAHHPLYPHE